MKPALLQALRDLLGAQHVLTEGDLNAYETDWRKRYKGKAMAVIRPGSTVEVAEAVRLCAAHDVSIVPQGGHTGLVGGGTPDESGQQIVLSLLRMNGVRSIDAANLTITLDAGCVLQAAQAVAAEAGLLLPLSLASEGSCTIGGNLASNAGGTQVLRYGNARELCLGLEVVTADGQIWHGLSGLRKDNSGYDLRHLFVGCEGTLGIITAAVMKLFPMPRAQLTAWAACDSLGQAQVLLTLARERLGDGLTAFELQNAHALALVGCHFPDLKQPLPPSPWMVLIEVSDGIGEARARDALEGLLEHALALPCASDAVIAQSLEQARALWHLRESIPLAQGREGLNIKHDISLPISRLADFVAQCDAAIQRRWPGARLVTFGHMGDGNLHYNVQAPLGVDPGQFLAEQESGVNRLVYDLVQSMGGSFSAEHGIGRLKRDELQARKDPTALGLMRSIKQVLDPKGLLNPSRVL